MTDPQNDCVAALEGSGRQERYSDDVILRQQMRMMTLK